MELVLVGRFLAACVVIGLVLFAIQLLARGVTRRSGAALPHGRLVAVLETTALPGAASLHVVRVAERYLVVGRSTSQIATLCELPADQVATWLVAAHATPVHHWRASLPDKRLWAGWRGRR